MKDERGESERGEGGQSLVYAVALRLLYGSLDCRTDTLAAAAAVSALRFLFCSSWLVVPIFSGHCQSNHI